MNILGIIGLVILFSGGICLFAAGILYDAPTQRYLEKLGPGRTPFGIGVFGLQDYWRAKEVAQRWGHKPEFLKRYGRIQAIGYALFFTGAALVLLQMI